MKNSSKIVIFLSALALPSVAFAAFAAVAASAANGEIAGSLLAIAGLQLVALADARRDRRSTAKPIVALAPPAAEPIACERRPSYGLRRRECRAA